MPIIIDTAERLDQLNERLSRRLGRDFLAMVASIRDRTKLAAVGRLLAAGRIEDALSIVTQEATAFANAASAGLVGAGEATSIFLDDHLAVRVSFDGTNDRAVRLIRESRLRLIREITDAQRRATRAALVEGTTQGLNPIAQARAFRDSIGLTDRQVRAVNNYRRLLSEDPAEALTRKLRDGRFDAKVRAAIREDRPLTRAEIDTMVTRYRQRSIKHRSEVIARTEALRAVHEGSDEAFTQAMEDGAIDPAEMTFRWITARDERVRGSHRTMHRQIRTAAQLASGTLFISGNGNGLRFPGDSRAPASDRIQCRCVRTARIEVPAQSTALAA